VNVTFFDFNSNMQRFMGMGKQVEAPPPPDMAEATGKLEERGKQIQEKINECDRKLIDYKEQIKNRGGASVKQKAMMELKKRKQYEQQLEQLMGSQMTLETVQFQTEQMQTTMMTVEAMAHATTAMKQQMGAINLDKLEMMQDDLEDMMMDQEEIQEVLGRNCDLNGVDDADLEAEFAALEEEVAFERFEPASAAPSYLPTQVGPSAEAAAPAPAGALFANQ